MNFNPNASAPKNSAIFGIPRVKSPKIVFLPVPWEASVSYGTGTASAPKEILKASKQIDLYHTELGLFYDYGFEMLKANSKIQNICKKSKKNIGKKKLNELSSKLASYVEGITESYLKKNITVCVVGGDHSVAFGAIRAYSKRFPKMGILQIDAHADLRKAFEGLEYSHASIMFNIINKTSVKKVVQAGLRDICDEEKNFIKSNKKKIKAFFDHEIFHYQAKGKNWHAICKKIIHDLPKQVYITFDIDGLDPKLCPSTGTPVPGGFSFAEINYLIKSIVKSGREIIGFDLCEVTPSKDDWDQNVGARILFNLSGWLIESKK